LTDNGCIEVQQSLFGHTGRTRGIVTDKIMLPFGQSGPGVRNSFGLRDEVKRQSATFCKRRHASNTTSTVSSRSQFLKRWIFPEA
jgi:hypothetical protein